MGHTSYWRRQQNLPPNKFAEASRLCKKVATKSGIDIRFELDVNKPAKFTKTLIRFNGIDEAGHETFMVERDKTIGRYDKLDNGKYFEFCKTAQKPYDVVVCACLIVLLHVLGPENVIVSSDGDDADWEPAKFLCARVAGFGREYSFGEDGFLTKAV